MPSLKYRAPGTDRFKEYRLHRRVTSIGSGDENDLTIADDSLQSTHALVQFDGKAFTVTPVNRKCKIAVNGRSAKKHLMAHRDELKMGDTTLGFHLYDEPAEATSAVARETIEAYQQLQRFSELLLSEAGFDELLERLMDAVLELTQGDKGFLILTEGGELQVKVARNVQRENIEDAVSQVSDSIVSKVIRSKKPLIVSDALHHTEFKSSLSVINLKLCSVMCVPLLDRGALLGLIYVGNDNIVNLFTESHLDVLSVFAAQASLIVANAMLLNHLRSDNEALRDQLESMQFGSIVGSSDAMKSVFRTVEKVAPTDVSVLIQGETGTGKELIAREIHLRSSRAKGPFVTINAAAIPENLLESELFGHVRGAFTGAVNTRMGKFQAANGGTLFLDEIGDMPLNLQVKMLRALQERVVSKVGDTRQEHVDIRVVAATHKDLQAAVKEGSFREDLYYRLNVVNLFLPALRARGDDIGLIAKYLSDRYCKEFSVAKRRLNNHTLIAMKKYPWPGNIRELENRLKKAVIMAEKTTITPEDLGLTAEDIQTVRPLADARDEWQRQYINEILALNNGNRTKTARDLGVDPRTIFRHLEKDG